jgi:hypothetical protein
MVRPSHERDISVNIQTFPGKNLLRMPSSRLDCGEESVDINVAQGGAYRLAIVYVHPSGDVLVQGSQLYPIAWERLLALTDGRVAAPERTGSDEVVAFGHVRVDFQRHEVHCAHRAVKLTTLELKILYYFVRNPCRVLSRQELLERVWGMHCYPTTRTVDNKILELRQKLEPSPRRPVHFITMHGAGYKFVP